MSRWRRGRTCAMFFFYPLLIRSDRFGLLVSGTGAPLYRGQEPKSPAPRPCVCLARRKEGMDARPWQNTPRKVLRPMACRCCCWAGLVVRSLRKGAEGPPPTLAKVEARKHG